MPFLILHGPLGSGKTTIAKELVKRLDAKIFHMDKVLQKLGLDTPTPNGGIPAENFIKANEVVLPETKKLLEQGRFVIFDACFYHKEVIEHLIQNLQFPHHVFTFKVPVEVCIARDAARTKTLGEDAARAVYGLVSRFDYGVNVDVSGTLEEAVVEIARSVSSPT